MRMPVARAAHHFPQRGLDGLLHGRVVEEHVAARRDVRRRLAVGDHDDLLRAGLAGQHLAGQREAVVHVGAVGEVPADLGQLRRRQLVRRLAEADEAHVVARELRGDQRVQRHRHLLRRQEVVAHRHAHRQVEHQHGRRARDVLGALDLEVVGRQVHRGAHRRRFGTAPDRVADGAVEVEVERIAELVLLGLVGALVALTQRCPSGADPSCPWPAC